MSELLTGRHGAARLSGKKKDSGKAKKEPAPVEAVSDQA
jgi:hypothetical protein